MQIHTTTGGIERIRRTGVICSAEVIASASAFAFCEGWSGYAGVEADHGIHGLVYSNSRVYA